MSTWRLCKYKDIAGEPGKGIHSHRFMGMAAVDLILTILGAVIIAYAGNFSILFTIIILMIIGIFAHWLFCVDTAMIRWLGLSTTNNPNPIIDTPTI